MTQTQSNLSSHHIMAHTRLILCDLDGTLLRPGHPISEQALATMAALRHQGYVIAVASGRSLYAGRNIVTPSMPIDYWIFSTGAGIVSWPQKKIIRRNELSQDDMPFEFEDGELIRCGYYGHEDIKDTQERMCRMVVDIYNVIEEYSPTIIVWEMPVVLRNPQTQRNLSILVGAIMGKCAEKDIFFYQFRPTEWRKLVKNDGETVPRKRDELKLWGINKVKELFNIEVEKDDESDAILIGQAYINMFKE